MGDPADGAVKHGVWRFAEHRFVGKFRWIVGPLRADSCDHSSMVWIRARAMCVVRSRWAGRSYFVHVHEHQLLLHVNGHVARWDESCMRRCTDSILIRRRWRSPDRWARSTMLVLPVARLRGTAQVATLAVDLLTRRCQSTMIQTNVVPRRVSSWNYGRGRCELISVYRRFNVAMSGYALVSSFHR